MNSLKRILLVDDDPDIREMIIGFLSSAEFEITSAADLGTAISALSNGNAFDLAILDFWLGTDHAVSLMDSAHSKAHNLPIIIISGGNGHMDLEKTEAISNASGAVIFLQKPFRKADLMEAVTSIIG